MGSGTRVEVLRDIRKRGELGLQEFSKVSSVQGFVLSSDLFNDSMYSAYGRVLEEYSNLNVRVRVAGFLHTRELMILFK